MIGELHKIRREIKNPGIEFKSLHRGASLLENLIELPATAKVPSSWILINSTKQFHRYHTPTILDVQDRINCANDELKLEFKSLWSKFIAVVDEELHESLRVSIQALGEMDVLQSLAHVGRLPGYIQPKYESTRNSIMLKSARHPLSELFLEKKGLSFVPNDVHLGCNFEEHHGQVVTGPNSGGKSSYVRMIALISLMGQIGCHVPASEANLFPIDGIFTRMGSGDDLASGLSTFVAELSRTNYILKKANSRSLVILDELGRGTSTHDGVAIATATLRYFLTRIGCCLLFITHFLPISEMIVNDSTHSKAAVNVHMSYIETNDSEDSHRDGKRQRLERTDDSEVSIDKQYPKITFLYKAVQGAAASSYGLNVARLVGLDDAFLSFAREKSEYMRLKS
jgi:DNA mismatch repair protein MSH3